MKKWEHKRSNDGIIRYDGENGWEAYETKPKDNGNTIYYVKRQIEEKE